MSVLWVVNGENMLSAVQQLHTNSFYYIHSTLKAPLFSCTADLGPTKLIFAYCPGLLTSIANEIWSAVSNSI